MMRTLYEERQEMSEAWTELCEAVKETWKLDVLLGWLMDKIKIITRKEG